MYVTRRLLRSTLEETTTVKEEPEGEVAITTEMVSPRKRRPLLETRAGHKASQSKSPKATPRQGENQGDKRNKRGNRDAAGLRGLGLLIDARDAKDRWCEAKILDLNAAEKSVFVHYVGWNTRYDCWLAAKFAAAHGSHTGVKPKAGSSWNGKDSLFSDPNAPATTHVKLTTKSSTKSKPAKAAPAAKSKKRRVDEGGPNDHEMAKSSPASNRTSSRTAVKVEVAVDAADEASDRKSRRGSRREKIDLELEMDVQGDDPAHQQEKLPTKRTRVSPTVKPTKSPAIATAKSPTGTRKPSPRASRREVVEESKAEVPSEVVGEGVTTTTPTGLQSPTVGMSALRRSARAKTSTKKKRKKEEDDSDEEYKEDEDEDEDEEEDDDEDEVDESDEDMPVRRSGSSNGKARRVSSGSSSASRRVSHGTITQWQTDPAYMATRERLATIFRDRLQQRGEFVADFQHGSFQQAMSGSSASSTPRSTVDEEAAANEEGPARKKKRAKTPKHVMSEEEKAAAAQYYYAQHYYQMQAYQYQQYMYQQALMAQHLEQQRLAERKSDDENASITEAEEKKDGDDEEKPPVTDPPTASSSSSPTTQASPVMNGGIIDPRFIHARMDALEHQKRVQLYYQHYAQATERNLQMLAASPEYLHTGANLWRAQVQNGHRAPQQVQKETNQSADVQLKTTPENEQQDAVEEKHSVSAKSPDKKSDESRQVEDAVGDAASATEQDTNVARSHPSSQAATPEATPEATDCLAPVGPGDNASSPPKNPDSQDAATQSPASSNDQPSNAKTEAVLFELVL